MVRTTFFRKQISYPEYFPFLLVRWILKFCITEFFFVSGIEERFCDVLSPGSDGILFEMVIFCFKHYGLVFVEDNDVLVFALSDRRRFLTFFVISVVTDILMIRTETKLLTRVCVWPYLEEQVGDHVYLLLVCRTTTTHVVYLPVARGLAVENRSQTTIIAVGRRRYRRNTRFLYACSERNIMKIINNYNKF